MLPAAFNALCPYGHGAVPGAGDTREGESCNAELVPSTETTNEGNDCVSFKNMHNSSSFSRYE